MTTLFIMLVAFFVVLMGSIAACCYVFNEEVKPSVKQRYAKMLKKETARRKRLLEQALRANKPPLFHSPKKSKVKRGK